VTDPREEKLPQWAKKILSDERHARAVAERKLAQHLETVEPTRISYGDYDNPLYIPDDFGLQTVHFDMGHREPGHLYDSISVGLRVDHDGVRYVEVSGGRGITIAPSASNVVRVGLGD
jgi:hypothetical protein